MATTHHYDTPVVEHHVSHDDDTSSSALMIVLLVAAVLIVGFLLFVMRAFPFNAVPASDDTTIDVNLPAAEMQTAPGANVPAGNMAPGTTY